uniref:fasciculation and elongation protein zeta-2-like n=1 Tax=Pristiophorus japonicus TaxID=55135 RepID=UPI00398F2CEA
MAAPLAQFDEDWQDFYEFKAPLGSYKLDHVNSNGVPSPAIAASTGFGALEHSLEDFSELDNFSGEIVSFKSMEDLVNDFDEKLTVCFRNYNTNTENIAPVKPISEESIMRDDEIWNALTDNYGNVMAVDWKTSHTRALHLPTLNLSERAVSDSSLLTWTSLCLQLHGGAPLEQLHGGAPLEQLHGGGAPPKQLHGGAPLEQLHGGAPLEQLHGGGAPLEQLHGGAPLEQLHGGAPLEQLHGGGAPLEQLHGGGAPPEQLHGVHTSQLTFHENRCQYMAGRPHDPASHELMRGIPCASRRAGSDHPSELTVSVSVFVVQAETGIRLTSKICLNGDELAVVQCPIGHSAGTTCESSQAAVRAACWKLNVPDLQIARRAALLTYAASVKRLPMAELNELLEEIETAIKDYSEELIQQLALRDELEFEKEVKNSFISILIEVQNKQKEHREMMKKKKKQKNGSPQNGKQEKSHMPGTRFSMEGLSNVIQNGFRQTFGSSGGEKQYLTTVIPYEKKAGSPSVEDLQILTKILQAMKEDSERVPSLLTDYILKVLCPT